MNRSRLFVILTLGIFVIAACQGRSVQERTRTPLKKIQFVPSIKIGTLWHTQVGKGIGRRPGTLTPLVSGQVVYANAVDGTIKAVALRNGKTIWQKNPGKVLASDVGAGLNNIFVATKSGQVLGLNKTNGRLSMKTPALGAISIAPVGSGSTIVTRTIDGKIYGLNPAGGIIWQQQHESPQIMVQSGARAVFYGTNVILGLDDGNLMALDSNTGALNWLEPVSYSHGRNIIDRLVDLDATPVKEGSNLFVVTFHGDIARIDADTGVPIWSQKYSSVEPPVISGQNLIATHEDGLISAFAKDSGTKLWEKRFLRGYNLSAPVAFGRYIAVGVKDANVIFWLDGVSGNLLAKSRVNGKRIMSLAGSPYGVVSFTRKGDLSLQRPL